jgi:hypothetical protein
LTEELVDYIHSMAMLVLLDNRGHWPPFEKPADRPRRSSRSCEAIERNG